MRDIDFLPSRFRRPTRHRRWRLGTFVSGSVLILILTGLHTMKPVQIGSAQTEAPGAATHKQDTQFQMTGVRHVYWTLPADRRVQDVAIDAVLAEAFATESRSMFVEDLDIQSSTIALRIHLHRDAGIPRAGDASMVSLLGPSEGKPLAGELIGLASTDMDIGVLLGRLSTCPFVVGPRLADARDTRLNDRTMREFRIVFDFLHGAGVE